MQDKARAVIRQAWRRAMRDARMNSWFKGAMTGLASFGAGFALLSVLLPPPGDPSGPPTAGRGLSVAPAPAPTTAPEPELSLLSLGPGQAVPGDGAAPAGEAVDPLGADPIPAAPGATGAPAEPDTGTAPRPEPDPEPATAPAPAPGGGSDLGPGVPADPTPALTSDPTPDATPDATPDPTPAPQATVPPTRAASLPDAGGPGEAEAAPGGVAGDGPYVAPDGADASVLSAAAPAPRNDAGGVDPGDAPGQSPGDRTAAMPLSTDPVQPPDAAAPEPATVAGEGAADAPPRTGVETGTDAAADRPAGSGADPGDGMGVDRPAETLAETLAESGSESAGDPVAETLAESGPDSGADPVAGTLADTGAETGPETRSQLADRTSEDATAPPAPAAPDLGPEDRLLQDPGPDHDPADVRAPRVGLFETGPSAQAPVPARQDTDLPPGQQPPPVALSSPDSGQGPEGSQPEPEPEPGPEPGPGLAGTAPTQPDSAGFADPEDRDEPADAPGPAPSPAPRPVVADTGAETGGEAGADIPDPAQTLTGSVAIAPATTGEDALRTPGPDPQVSTDLADAAADAAADTPAEVAATLPAMVPAGGGDNSSAPSPTSPGAALSAGSGPRLSEPAPEQLAELRPGGARGPDRPEETGNLPGPDRSPPDVPASPPDDAPVPTGPPGVGNALPGGPVSAPPPGLSTSGSGGAGPAHRGSGPATGVEPATGPDTAVATAGIAPVTSGGDAGDEGPRGPETVEPEASTPADAATTGEDATDENPAAGPAPAAMEAEPAPLPEPTPAPPPGPPPPGPSPSGSTAAAAGPDMATAPGTGPASVPDSAPDPATDPAPDAMDDAVDGPEAGPEPAASPARPALIRRPGDRPAPSGRLTPGSSVAGVQLGRLPQVAAPTVSAGDAGAAPAEDDTPPMMHDLPRWQRHAVPVDPGPVPRVGLVLLDLTRDLAAEAALVELPYAVTVGLDPFDPDALRRALIYRAAGHEIVLSLAGVSPLSTASDLEVLFSAWIEDFPEALGVVDPPGGDGRRSRALAQVLVPVLRDTGLGLLAPEQGLSPLLSAARAGGVAQAGLYRSLDPADETADAVRRFLDRAAFEAERLGGIAVIGRADRPETREGLSLWLQSPRAARVASVPAGAVLSVQGAP